jgi:hypothetical protein
MKKLLIYLLDLCAYLYSQLIIFNLYLLRSNSKKYYYNHSLAYGDSLCYYLHNYREIISNKKNIPLAFGSYHQEIVELFFSKYKTLFFKIFDFMPYYRLCRYICKSKYFKPIINYKFLYLGIPEDELLLSKNHDVLFKKILAKHKIRREIRNLVKDKSICLFFKYYNDNINDVSNGSIIRQTTDIKKIELIISFLISQKFKIFILGNYKDKGTNLLKKKYTPNNHIFFLADFKCSVTEQIYIAKKSSGYIGNFAGNQIPFILLKKRMVTFDSCLIPSIETHKKLKNTKFLFKKVIINKKKKVLDIYNVGCKKKIQIVENSFKEIKPAIEKIFLH